MGIIRPATPGFLATLAATILLAVVSFCVPYFKTIYFLKANIDQGGTKGAITFGTLGYCIELSNGTTCSKPSVGYELDINSLVGNELPIDIPNVVVKWITYALVLHIVAFGFAAVSAFFGLLAHVREMSMACCSTFVSGFAAVVAMLAFIFDLVLFFAAKARINDVGKAEMGNAIWLTLAAWLLLFFSGCFYTIGRCCVSKRGPRSKEWKDPEGDFANRTDSDQMRLNAVKAEADRKNRKQELGLPEFHETQPLTAKVDGDNVYIDDYADHPTSRPTAAYTAGGYVPAAAGSRAVDEYYNPTSPPAAAATGYPPTPRRQGSNHTYASNFSNNMPTTTSPPPMPSNSYMAAGGAAATGYAAHGHGAGGSTYHSAQQPSGYYDQGNNAYSDPYSTQTPPAQAAQYPPATSYYTPAAATMPSHAQPERNYTLSGDGYGENSVPHFSGDQAPVVGGYYGQQQHSPSPNNAYPGSTSPVPNSAYMPTRGVSAHSPGGALPYPGGSGINTNILPSHQAAHSPDEQHYDEAPPGYDAGVSGTSQQHPGGWDVKR